MKFPKGISINICCFNSAARLPETLDHIARQNIPKDFLWEIIIVDNKSTDNTSKIALQIWESYDHEMPLRVVYENRQGLSFAREKAIEESKFEYILFCDDDNWLNENYLKQSFEVLRKDNTIGILGGYGEAVCQNDFPVWFDNLASFYAVGKQATTNGDMKNRLLYGAGMIIRKSYYMKIREAGFTFLLEDRTGNKLSSGGDYELCLAFRLAGYKLWYDERLKFKHFIPQSRLSLGYLKKLSRGNLSTMFVTVAYYDHLKNYPINFLLFVFLGFKQVLKIILFTALNLTSLKGRLRIGMKWNYLFLHFRSWSAYKVMREHLNEWTNNLSKDHNAHSVNSR